MKPGPICVVDRLSLDGSVRRTKITTILLFLIGPVAAQINETGTYPIPDSSPQRHLQQQAIGLCPIGRAGRPKKYVVRPEENDFNEVSYMVHSEQKFRGNHVMWMGSDGFRDRISAVDMKTGKVIQSYQLDFEMNFALDWEAISLGPCDPTKKKVCLYIGAIGNNNAKECRRSNCNKGLDEVVVYKLEEPDVRDKVNEKLKVGTLKLNYRHNKLPTDRADAEALFVDHTGDTNGGRPGDLYMITKFPGKGTLQRVTKVEASQHKNLKFGTMSARVEPVAQPQGKNVWNGADMSLDGSLIALRGGKNIKFFPRLKSQTVAEALTGGACSYFSKSNIGGDRKKYEAVTMVGQDVAEASECTGQKMCPVVVTLHRLQYRKKFIDLDEMEKRKKKKIRY